MASTTPQNGGIRMQTGFMVVDAKLIHFINYIDCVDELQTKKAAVPSLQSLAMMQLSTLELENVRYYLGKETWIVLESTATTDASVSSLNTDIDYISFEYVDCCDGNSITYNSNRDGNSITYNSNHDGNSITYNSNDKATKSPSWRKSI